MCTATGAYVTGLDCGTPKLTRGWRGAPTTELEQLLTELEDRETAMAERLDALSKLTLELQRELDAREAQESDPAYLADRQAAQDASASLQDRGMALASYAS